MVPALKKQPAPREETHEEKLARQRAAWDAFEREQFPDVPLTEAELEAARREWPED